MPNRLASETSPYLLQHAENPVDWYPWGREALERAAELDRPILLSIGYSACHWCHVMERESFEDAETARFMNEHFVPIKVDREERPDVDSIYMEAVQGMTGHGGWPLTAFLDTEGVPFYGGTYFPPDPAPGDAELPDGDGGRGPELGHPARADPRGGGADPQPARARRADRALGRSAHPGRGRGRGQRPAGGGRHGARRLRLGAQVPARLGARADADRRRARPGGDDPERDRRRRHQRSRRRRLRPLLGRRDLARPPLREDALRQRAARPRLPARLPGARRRALARDRRADARLGAARDARPRGRVLLRPRRRLRGRGGVVLRLDPGRRSARCWPGPGSATRRRS